MSEAPVTRYDRVFDSRMHFRTLLDAMARPGTVGALQHAGPPPHPCVATATLLVALALLNEDVSFNAEALGPAAADFLCRQTSAGVGACDTADFLFLPGTDATKYLALANPGTLQYPDEAATAVIQVANISAHPAAGALRLELSGPGIRASTTVFVSGLDAELLAELEEKNAEFPRGVDAILTCDAGAAGPCVMCLPRTTNVVWEPGGA